MSRMRKVEYTPGIKLYWDDFCKENPRLVKELENSNNLQIAKSFYLKGVHNTLLDMSVKFANMESKSVKFVKHIENHLKDLNIHKGKVLCKICGMDIDEIYQSHKPEVTQCDLSQKNNKEVRHSSH